MYLEHRGIRLNGKLDLPENEAERSPLAILVHGFTGHMEEPHIRAVARTMNELGFAVLRLELYGHGQSGGSFHDHDIQKWVEELVYAIDTVKRLDFVSELWLCGHSQGGLAVMLAAARRSESVRGLIPLSPAWRIPEWARAGNVLGMRFDPKSIPEDFSLGDGVSLGRNYAEVAQTIDAEAAIRAYEGPVLIIHGTADATVPFSDAEQAAKLYRHCTLVPIEGDTHCYDRHLEQVTEAIRAWMPK